MKKCKAVSLKVLSIYLSIFNALMSNVAYAFKDDMTHITNVETEILSSIKEYMNDDIAITDVTSYINSLENEDKKAILEGANVSEEEFETLAAQNGDKWQRN